MTKWIQNKNGVVIPRREAGFIQPGIGLMNKKQGSGGGDPYWNNVTSLMHFNGANNGTIFTDQVVGNTWTSTPSGIVTSTSQSKFNGSSLYIANTVGGSGRAHLAGTSAIGNCFTGIFTVEVWAYLLAYEGTYGTSIANNDITTGPRGVTCSLTLSGHYIQLVNTAVGSYIIATINPVTLNTWHFLSWSFDGTKGYVFVDGALSGSGTWTKLAAANGNTFNWGAQMDNITVSNMYLAEGRVTSGVCRYTTSFTSPTAPFPNHA